MRLAIKTGPYAVTHFIVVSTVASFFHERLWERFSAGALTVPRHAHP